MKFVHILFGAAALGVYPLAALAQPAPAVAEPATLSVGGDGLVQRSPDLARVALTIVSDDDDATRSAGKNTTIYDALEAKLSALGIGKDAVRTTYFNVDFVAHPAKNVPPQDLAPRYGYITTRSLTVDVAPIETAGKIVDAATRAGVTTIGGVSFDLRDRKSAYHGALIAAMVDAQASAVALVKGGGLHIVRVLRISTSSAERPIRPFAAASFNARMAAPASEPPTDIAPNGPIDVSAHVDVTYEIR